MLLPVICFCFSCWAPGEYSARCAHGRASPIQDRRLHRLISSRMPCVALSISNLPIGPDSRFRVCLEGPSRGCREVEQTINQLLQRTMQLIVQARTIEFPLGLLDSEKHPASRQPTGSSLICSVIDWSYILIAARIQRSSLFAPVAIAATSIPSRRPVCYCKETTGIGRLLQCCCSCNVREQTACTVISGMLFRVSPSMRMRPGGISCGWKL